MRSADYFAHINTQQDQRKKLSCRREAAQRSVSLKTLLLLKVTQDHSKLHC